MIFTFYVVQDPARKVRMIIEIFIVCQNYITGCVFYCTYHTNYYYFVIYTVRMNMTSSYVGTCIIR